MFCTGCRLLSVPRLARSYAAPTAVKTIKRQPSRKQLRGAEPELAMTSKVLPSSLKKMGDIARLIQHKPLDHAMLQMKFSKKRHAPHLEKLLRNAMNGAIRKGMDGETLVVDQAWVTKGEYVKRLWIKGRGRMAIQRRPRVRIDIRVRDKTTLERRKVESRAKRLRRMMPGVGLVNRPLYNSAVFTC